MTSPPRTPAPSPLTANPVPAKVSVSMHATPPVAAPPSASVQHRQIALVAAAAVLAFALAFGIGKAVSSGPETSTAAPPPRPAWGGPPPFPASAPPSGTGRPVRRAPEPTPAAPERPQAIKVAAVSVVAAQPSAGAIAALKDPAGRPKRHQASSSNSSSAGTSSNGTQQQTTQQQTQTAQPQQRTVAPQKQAPAKKKEPVITIGGGEN